MDFKKMENLLEDQKRITQEYESLVSKLAKDDLLNENFNLKKELRETKEKLNLIEDNYKEKTKSNINLRSALRDQMFNEKIEILNISKRKINLYFKDESKKNKNKLTTLEKETKQKIKKIEKVVASELNSEKNLLLNKLNDISNEVETLVKEKQERLELQKKDIMEELKSEYEELKNEKLSEETIEKKKKQNNLEVKIGLNWINKVGIIILLLGIATAMQYTYSTWFSDYMKGIFGFVIGGAFLIGGEWFNKKNKNIFSLGLCGTGIATLYITIFSSYFLLGILTISTGILLSILVTGVSFVLSQRYNSLSITALSLIGGYLPFFSYSYMETLVGNQIYIAMGYLLVLNLLVLVVSFNKRWIKINYLSFFLNIPSLLYLISIVDNKNIALIYSLVTFMMYLGITLVYPFIKEVKLRIYDIILLSINTILNSLITYALFDMLNYNDYFGFLALAYSVTYLLLANLMKKNEEKKTLGLFYIASMTFAILMIPFQFGIEWALFGWLIQAVLVLTFGVYHKESQFELAGWIILGLSSLRFFIFEYHYTFQKFYQFKYFSLTLAFIYVLGLYLLNSKDVPILSKTRKYKFLKGYKYFVIISTWIYTISTSRHLFNKYIDLTYGESFFRVLLLSMLTVLFGYFISNIDLLKDKVVNIISVFLYILGDIAFLSLNLTYISVNDRLSLRILITAILIIFNILVFLNIKNLILNLLKYKKISFDFYPLTLAIYLLGIISAFLINQFNFENINLIISILFIVLSFGYIYYGFKKHYVLLRRFGLGLSIFSTAKLFIMDLSFLDSVGKIIAYLCFGLILISISFLYQKLKNEMDI